MKLLIDYANINVIKELYEYYPIDGVTTNPSILAKSGIDSYLALKEIRSFIGSDSELHVQVISRSAEDIIEEAHEITKQLGSNTYVKIPCINEGLKAIKVLHKENINITATVVYTPLQALLAAKCGANYVAPYINRIDNMGYDGVNVAKRIQDIFKANGYPTKILGASFKNSSQVLQLCEYGIASCTCAPDVIKNFISNAAIDAAIDSFVKDFEYLCGDGKTMKDIAAV